MTMADTDRDRELIESMARADDVLTSDERSPDHMSKCGNCTYQWLMAEVAREFAAAERWDVRAWIDEVARRWDATEFVRLWTAETEAGRDPRAAFEARGWIP